jgi:hypothetical protein
MTPAAYLLATLISNLPSDFWAAVALLLAPVLGVAIGLRSGVRLRRDGPAAGLYRGQLELPQGRGAESVLERPAHRGAEHCPVRRRMVYTGRR